MPCQHNHGQTIATSSTVADDLPSRRSHTDSEVSNTVRSDALDIEKGPPQYERIVLVIEGLQCGCCEGGIERYLTRLAPVRNYQVNIVLARLELELNVSRLSVSDLVTKLHRKTGYKFELLEESGSQTLELLVSAQLDLQRLDRPPGVTLLEHSGYRQRTLSRSSCAVPRQQPTDGAVQPALPTPLSIFKRCFPPLHNGHATRRSNRQAKQSLIRLHYNADEVGARDIFEFYLRLDPDIHLAPRPAHPSLASGSNQIQRALRYFIPALICTIPVVVVAWAPVDHENLAYLHASLVLATVVQLIATKEFLPGPLRCVTQHHCSNNSLIIRVIGHCYIWGHLRWIS